MPDATPDLPATDHEAPAPVAAMTVVAWGLGGAVVAVLGFFAYVYLATLAEAGADGGGLLAARTHFLAVQGLLARYEGDLLLRALVSMAAGGALAGVLAGWLLAARLGQAGGPGPAWRWLARSLLALLLGLPMVSLYMYANYKSELEEREVHGRLVERFAAARDLVVVRSAGEVGKLVAGLLARRGQIESVTDPGRRRELADLLAAFVDYRDAVLEFAERPDFPASDPVCLRLARDHLGGAPVASLSAPDRLATITAAILAEVAARLARCRQEAPPRAGPAAGSP